MDELEKWAKDKPQSLVMFAFIWATVADYLHLLLKDNNRTFYEAGLTNVPSVKMWLKFYKNHRLLMPYLWKLIITDILKQTSFSEWAMAFLLRTVEDGLPGHPIVPWSSIKLINLKNNEFKCLKRYTS